MYGQLLVNFSFELVKYFRDYFPRNEKLIERYVVVLSGISHFLKGKRESPKLFVGIKVFRICVEYDFNIQKPNLCSSGVIRSQILNIEKKGVF